MLRTLPPPFGKLWKARSRLYRSRFLRPKRHFVALAEIYKIHIMLQVSERRISAKKIISFNLIKSDLEPTKNALHLDCCLQPVGNGKLVACPEAFLKREQYKWLVDYFGEENILEISLSEMSEMNCNFFSIDTNIVVSEKSFTRLNSWLRSFDILVEEINYKEISKQGGLLRCSTLPLKRA